MKAISHHDVEIGSERSFGFVFTIIFSLIGVWPIFAGSGFVRWWAVIFATAILSTTLVKPELLKPLNYGWFKFGLLLGKVVAPVIMMLVFFIAVTPTAMLAKVMGKDPLRLKKSGQNKDTFWIDRRADDGTATSMKNQF